MYTIGLTFLLVLIITLAIEYKRRDMLVRKEIANIGWIVGFSALAAGSFGVMTAVAIGAFTGDYEQQLESRTEIIAANNEYVRGGNIGTDKPSSNYKILVETTSDELILRELSLERTTIKTTSTMPYLNTYVKTLLPSKGNNFMLVPLIHECDRTYTIYLPPDYLNSLTNPGRE